MKFTPSYVSHEAISSLRAYTPSTSSTVINGTLDGFKTIFRAEGASGLWRGLNVTLVAALPSTVIYYVGYDVLRSKLKVYGANNKNFDIYSPLLAGCIARSISATIISPLELTRTIMQSSSSMQLSVVTSGLKQLIKTDGLRTLWAGLLPTLWRDVPFSAAYWFGYEQISSMLTHEYDTGAKSFTTTFVSGALSGSIAAVLTNPFDVAKTARQVALNNNNGFGSLPAAGSFNPQTSASNVKVTSIIRNIIANEGWAGLYTGLAPRLIKIAPACAIMITSYEFGKSLFIK
ncbi:Solute carrier family 25 member 40 [Smittium culicis]|uniref:Solute carrier family 25 member 40 n=1 Tax=Smittium culicis TaxID=133412 RepID=A0A1R1XPY2_9FUNG|nr:Solute carrier family 25 member 40 [Smittium culicis]OMJ16683.1 Solute carrier family 25 member 40 [Smittium culicis]